MAAKLNVLVLAIVLINLNVAFSRDCSSVDTIMSCNECIRCGAHWCSSPNIGTSRCMKERLEDWCPESLEPVTRLKDEDIAGDTVSLKYAERSRRVGQPSQVLISYSSNVEKKIEILKVNTTQNFDIDVSSKTECVAGNCTATITASSGTNFCSATSIKNEYVNVKVIVDSDEVLVKYHVPCACECAGKPEKFSKFCNSKGDYNCGVCSCYDGWTGADCTEKICKARRGDIQCTDTSRNAAECSGNGKCGNCDTCECYSDRPGWQYFEEDNFCADLCMTVNDCNSCLIDPEPGSCSDCPYVNMLTYNKTIVHDMDEYNRTIWVKCNETYPDGRIIDYVAMKDVTIDTIYVMPIIPGKEETAPVVTPAKVNVTIPVLLALLGLLAAAGVAGGFTIYRNRTPPLPLTNPQYQNIDAQESTGENPIYKPPTSNFKNPTYGKW